MLDILPNSPEGFNHRTPMDFSPYLLSASPPALSFELLGYSSHHGYTNIGIGASSFQNANFTGHQSFPSYPMSQPNQNNLSERRKRPLKSIIIRSEYSSDSEGETVVSTPDSSESLPSPCRTSKKSVSFADHRGLALAHVRLVNEGPDEPPELNPDLIASLTLGANADVTDCPPIKLCFPQPASDYLAFRDKLTKNFVSLENVILRDYTVEGTIKVKNTSFERRVFVRFTQDEWETNDDHEGIYVPGPGQGSCDPFDTFSFKIDIAPNFDVSKQLQFAVCYEENSKQHWDNNDGLNYTVVSENYEAHKPQPQPSLPEPAFTEGFLPEGRTDSWSEFTAWRDVNTDNPYY